VTAEQENCIMRRSTVFYTKH